MFQNLVARFSRTIISSPTFGELVAQWADEQECRLRAESLKESRRSLRIDGAPLFHNRIDALTRSDVKAVLDAMKDRPGAQRQLHSNIRRVCRWAISSGLLERDPTAGIRTTPPKARERVLTEPELRAVWWASQEMGDYGRILRLLMLTGQRRDEIGDLVWAEIEETAIHLPGERTKNHKPHIVPLTPLAISQLPERSGSRPWLFGNQKNRPFNSWGRCKEVLDQTLIGMKPWVVHDLRRSFVTHMAERGLAEPHIIEAVVNHISGHQGGVAGVYNKARYASQKREALQAWSAHVQRMVSEP